MKISFDVIDKWFATTSVIAGSARKVFGKFAPAIHNGGAAIGEQ